MLDDWYGEMGLCWWWWTYKRYCIAIIAHSLCRWRLRTWGVALPIRSSVLSTSGLVSSSLQVQRVCINFLASSMRDASNSAPFSMAYNLSSISPVISAFQSSQPVVDSIIIELTKAAIGNPAWANWSWNRRKAREFQMCCHRPSRILRLIMEPCSTLNQTCMIILTTRPAGIGTELIDLWIVTGRPRSLN
jgi:hypothetical protein